MNTSTIHIFCSCKDSTSHWFASIRKSHDNEEFIEGVINQSTTGEGILTALSKGLREVESGTSVTVVSTVEQNLKRGENKELKGSILDLCESKRLNLTFVVDMEEARNKSQSRRPAPRPILTRNLSSIQVQATGSYPSETDDRVDLLARVDKFGNRKPRTILSEPFESMWIPVAVVCQCGGEVLLEFLGLFPEQNKTVTCQCGWTVEVGFRMGSE